MKRRCQAKNATGLALTVGGSAHASFLDTRRSLLDRSWSVNHERNLTTHLHFAEQFLPCREAGRKSFAGMLLEAGVGPASQVCQV